MRHNIFAMEICMRMDTDDSLRCKLRDLIRDHAPDSSPGKKWNMLQRAASLLADGEDRFERGCWDFFDDDTRALNDYGMWCNGMTTEEGARKSPSGGPGEGQRYMTFTISLLLEASTASSRDVGRLCDIPQNQLWKRKTFLRILGGLSCVSFAAVKSDVYYLIPGDDEWGLTHIDLATEKFHYLRTIED
jgi:hypothetical protein